MRAPRSVSHVDGLGVMDADRFDNVARALTGNLSRRGTLGLGLGGLLASLLGSYDAEAKRGKNKNKNKKGKKGKKGKVGAASTAMTAQGHCVRRGFARRVQRTRSAARM